MGNSYIDETDLIDLLEQNLTIIERKLSTCADPLIQEAMLLTEDSRIQIEEYKRCRT